MVGVLSRLTRGPRARLFLAVPAPARARAVPPPLDLAGRRVLVVAPHPDDEALGCWGLLKASATAATVGVALVTDGGAPRSESIELRERRVAESRALLGNVAQVEMRRLGLPDGELRVHVAALRAKLEALVAEFAPDLVLAPAPTDGTDDHAVVSEQLAGLPAGRLYFYRSTWATFPLEAADHVIRVDWRAKARAMDGFRSQRHLPLGDAVLYSAVEARRVFGDPGAAEAFVSAGRFAPGPVRNMFWPSSLLRRSA
jgi:hypothetical protein